jgi:hypothetical protein
MQPTHSVFNKSKLQPGLNTTTAIAYQLPERNNMKLKKLLKQTPRLREWADIGPVQMAELEQFAQALLDSQHTAVTADGVLAKPGDPVWVISSTGKPELTAVKPTEAVTGYYLFGDIPVTHSFSTKDAVRRYQQENPR